MPTKKKKFNARFPPARIKKIMQSDEDVGKVAAPVPVIISKSLELFVETLLTKVNGVTTARGARTLTPSHLKMCIHSETRFDFLKDLVATVPDLQGEMDEQPSTPIDAIIPPPAMFRSMSVEERPARVARTKSAEDRPVAPRPRGRPRKDSTEKAAKRPRKVQSANTLFVETDSDISDSESSSNPIHSSSSAPHRSLSYTLGAAAVAPPPTAVSFTLSYPAAVGPTANGGGGMLPSQPTKLEQGPRTPLRSSPNGLFSVSRILDKSSSTTTNGSSKEATTQPKTALIDVDEDYDA